MAQTVAQRSAPDRVMLHSIEGLSVEARAVYDTAGFSTWQDLAGFSSDEFREYLQEVAESLSSPPPEVFHELDCLRALAVQLGLPAELQREGRGLRRVLPVDAEGPEPLILAGSPS